MDEELKQLRKAIDLADQEILKALAKRMDVVARIGILKAKHAISPIDKKRWKEVLDSKIATAESLGLSTEMVKDIYERIYKEALKIEYEK